MRWWTKGRCFKKVESILCGLPKKPSYLNFSPYRSLICLSYFQWVKNEPFIHSRKTHWRNQGSKWRVQTADHRPHVVTWRRRAARRRCLSSSSRCSRVDSDATFTAAVRSAYSPSVVVVWRSGFSVNLGRVDSFHLGSGMPPGGWISGDKKKGSKKSVQKLARCRRNPKWFPERGVFGVKAQAPWTMYWVVNCNRSLLRPVNAM